VLGSHGRAVVARSRERVVVRKRFFFFFFSFDARARARVVRRLAQARGFAASWPFG
jgi:hypothetical protein